MKNKKVIYICHYPFTLNQNILFEEIILIKMKISYERRSNYI